MNNYQKIKVIHFLCNADLYLCCGEIIVCVRVRVHKPFSPLPDISPDRGGSQQYSMIPCGLEQIKTLYSYVEEANALLINTSLYRYHMLWCVEAGTCLNLCVCVYVCAVCACFHVRYVCYVLC